MKKLPDQKSLKEQLRTELRQQRAGLDEIHRNVLDTAINTHLVNYVRSENHRTVAAYLAFDGEPDLSLALTKLEQQGVTLALPVVQDAPGRSSMSFCRWSTSQALRPNRFGIAEPVGFEEITAPQIDLMLLPLVGWDRHGSRLGMGASYYDRVLQPFAQAPRPVRMGVGYTVQETGQIPTEPWDIPLQIMLTENGWFTCGA